MRNGVAVAEVLDRRMPNKPLVTVRFEKGGGTGGYSVDSAAVKSLRGVVKEMPGVEKELRQAVLPQRAVFEKWEKATDAQMKDATAAVSQALGMQQIPIDIETQVSPQLGTRVFVRHADLGGVVATFAIRGDNLYLTALGE
jgi:hypothetical protein